MPRLEGSADQIPRYREGPNNLPNGGKEYMRIAIAAKWVAMLVLALSLAVAMVACQGAVGKPGEAGEAGDPGKPAEALKPAPVLLTPFSPEMLVEEGAAATIDVAGHFHDIEGQTLTYTASSSDDSVATVAIAGSVVTIQPVAMGDATVTVTATDPDDKSVSADIKVTVAAEGMMPPIYLETLPDSISVLVREFSVIKGADVETAFEEQEGEFLTFAVSVNPVDGSIVSAEILSNKNIQINAEAVGEATVTITATDEDAATATHDILVTVVVSSQPVAGGPIGSQSLEVGGADAVVDVSGAFSDPLGDTLTYTADSSTIMWRPNR